MGVETTGNQGRNGPFLGTGTHPQQHFACPKISKSCDLRHQTNQRQKPVFVAWLFMSNGVLEIGPQVAIAPGTVGKAAGTT